jgi:protease-4
MLSSKKRKSPTNIKESLNDNADRFYKMFRIHTTAKVAMSLIAMTAVGFSFYNLYEQWQDAEGKKDHIAVIRIWRDGYRLGNGRWNSDRYSSCQSLQ